MNLLLFKDMESMGFINHESKAYWHILNILKSRVGDRLDCGIINGPIGELIIKNISTKGIDFDYSLIKEPSPLYPVTMIIGTPRPPVAKRLLKDLTSAGVKKIIMTGTDLGEKTYMTSKLWRDELYRDYILDGLIQGESTLLPEVERFYSVKKAIESLEISCDRIVLDNISPEYKISSYLPVKKEVVIAIGGERGFTDRERELFKENGFTSYSMGERVLRTESVCHQILGTVLSARGLI